MNAYGESCLVALNVRSFASGSNWEVMWPISTSEFYQVKKKPMRQAPDVRTIASCICDCPSRPRPNDLQSLTLAEKTAMWASAPYGPADVTSNSASREFSKLPKVIRGRLPPNWISRAPAWYTSKFDDLSVGLADLIFSHVPSAVGAADVDWNATKRSGHVGVLALVNKDTHKQIASDWIQSQLLKRVGDETRFLHDAQVSGDIRRVFNGLFVTPSQPSNVAENSDDEGAAISDGDDDAYGD